MLLRKTINEIILILSYYYYYYYYYHTYLVRSDSPGSFFLVCHILNFEHFCVPFSFYRVRIDISRYAGTY